MPELCRCKFHYQNRNQQKTLVLIPGWAYDCRIFDSLDLPFNYLMATEVCTQGFNENLRAYLRRKAIAGVSFFGWSLGAFLAVSFAASYPELVEELILVGIRRKYESQDIKDIKSLLKKNLKAYLYTFYKQCFSGSSHMGWFKRQLLKSYSEKFSLAYLCQELSYLEHAEINTRAISGIKKIKIIHGQDDAVAAIEEAVAIKNDLPQAELIRISNSGHVPFLDRDFKKYFGNG